MNLFLTLMIIALTADLAITSRLPEQDLQRISLPIEKQKNSINFNILVKKDYHDYEQYLPKRLLADEEQQKLMDRQNQDAFKGLRQGLNDWPAKPQQRLRRSSQQEFVNKLNEKNYAQIQSPKKTVLDINPDQLFQEAKWIDQEEMAQQINTNIKSKSTLTDLQLAFYLIISVLIGAYLIKCIKQRCFQRKTTIQAHHQEAQTLSNL